MRIARYHLFTIGDRRLKFLWFADPDHLDGSGSAGERLTGNPNRSSFTR